MKIQCCVENSWCEELIVGFSYNSHNWKYRDLVSAVGSKTASLQEYNSRAAELALGNSNDTDEKVERAEKNKTVKESPDWLV